MNSVNSVEVEEKASKVRSHFAVEVAFGIAALIVSILSMIPISSDIVFDAVLLWAAFCDVLVDVVALIAFWNVDSMTRQQEEKHEQREFLERPMSWAEEKAIRVITREKGPIRGDDSFGWGARLLLAFRSWIPAIVPCVLIILYWRDEVRNDQVLGGAIIVTAVVSLMTCCCGKLLDNDGNGGIICRFRVYNLVARDALGIYVGHLMGQTAYAIGFSLLAGEDVFHLLASCYFGCSGDEIED